MAYDPQRKVPNEKIVSFVSVILSKIIREQLMGVYDVYCVSDIQTLIFKLIQSIIAMRWEIANEWIMITHETKYIHSS